MRRATKRNADRPILFFLAFLLSSFLFSCVSCLSWFPLFRQLSPFIQLDLAPRQGIEEIAVAR
jgi:hypothetical protein